MEDPFYEVKREVQQSLTGVTLLFDRWKDLQNRPGQEDELTWTSNEIKTGLKNIEWDLQDLDETVLAVESNPVKFRIDQQELSNRKEFIRATKREIQEIKDALDRARGRAQRGQRDTLMGGGSVGSEKFQRFNAAVVEDNERFIKEQQDQQMILVQDQDKDLEQLEHTVGTLGELGREIGRELDDQHRMLEEFDSEVDSTSSRMGQAIKKVNTIIRQSKDGKSWCFILLLIAVLLGLVVVVFYV